jgi:hypothetical protein
MKFTPEQTEQLNQELGAVAVAGPWGSGKSLFALTRPILPGKEVVWLHTEPSGANYASLYKVTRIEVNSMKDLREALAYIGKANGKVGHVIMDTVAPLEDWIHTEVTSGLDHKGQPNQNKSELARFQRENGAAWGETKRREGLILQWIKANAPAMTITSHMRTKYIGNQPSPQKEPRAKEVVYQYVSLFLILERIARQPAPAAEVLKTTLMCKKAWAERQEIKPVLPPKLPIATWDTIWAYIENPVDMDNLKPEEQSTALSDVESLRLLAKIVDGPVEE